MREFYDRVAISATVLFGLAVLAVAIATEDFAKTFAIGAAIGPLALSALAIVRHHAHSRKSSRATVDAAVDILQMLELLSDFQSRKANEDSGDMGLRGTDGVALARVANITVAQHDPRSVAVQIHRRGFSTETVSA